MDKISFITFVLGMAFLLVFIWELFRAINEESFAKRETKYREQLKDARCQNKDLEYMVCSLEHQKDILNVELENQRQLCDIFEEISEVYKERMRYLEKMGDNTPHQSPMVTASPPGEAFGKENDVICRTVKNVPVTHF